MNKRLISILTVLCMVLSMSVSVSAAGVSYTFKGTNIAKPNGLEDAENAELTKDISVTTSGDANWKTAAVTDLKHNKDCGFYPINESFKPKGSYIFLATGSTNDNTVFTLHLPQIEAGSRVTLTYAKPVITNNGSTRRNENDPYAYFKIADRYVSINGGDFDTFISKSVVIGEGTDTIDFVCDKWGAAAIEKIEIAPGDASVLHKLTVDTARYANVTVNGIKLCADSEGKLDAGSFAEGEEISVTAQKDGYFGADTVIAMGKTDMSVSAVPECEKYAEYYESDFGNNSGKLMFKEDNEKYYLNTSVKDATQLFGEITFTEGSSITLYAENSEPIMIMAMREDGIYANGEHITTKDNMQFKINFDKSLNSAWVVQNDDTVVINDGDMPNFEEFSYIMGMGSLSMDYIGISYPDTSKIKIDCPDVVSSSALNDVEVSYSAVPEYELPGDKSAYGNKKSYITGNDKVISYYPFMYFDGFTVKAGADGKATLNVEYNGATASKEITIVPNAKITEYDIGNTVMNLYSSQTFALKSVKDEFGNDFLDYMNYETGNLKDFKSSDENVIKIDANGIMTAVGCGTATISADAYTGADNIVTAEYTVDSFYIRGNAYNTAAYEENIFAENENITGYKIIRLGLEADKTTEEKIEPLDIPAAVMTADGTLITARYSNEGTLYSVTSRPVKKGDKTEISTDTKKIYFFDGNSFEKVTEAADTIEGFKIEVDGTYEISPVYTFTDIGDVSGEGKTLDAVFADGRYNITFKKGETWRGDIYVNGYMVGNNVDQADADRKVTNGAIYTAEDIFIYEGRINVSMTDGSTMLDYVTVEPTWIDKQRIFIIGDSLACEYYGEFSQEVGGGRSGWGQQLHSFVNVPITNLANSGQYAAGLYKTAFPGVIEHAKAGDILLIECGYNDRSYSTREEMTACVKSMIRECRENGITPIIVTPNASKHDYKESVSWSSYLRDIAVDEHCQIIDLSKQSYNFLYSLYGDDEDNVVTMNYNLTAVGGDTLHSSYAGAYVWASMVAQGLTDLGYGELINTDFKYSFTDTLGNKITAEVK